MVRVDEVTPLWHFPSRSPTSVPGGWRPLSMMDAVRISKPCAAEPAPSVRPIRPPCLDTVPLITPSACSGANFSASLARRLASRVQNALGKIPWEGRKNGVTAV
jgi:hypothetical protein